MIPRLSRLHDFAHQTAHDRLLRTVREFLRTTDILVRRNNSPTDKDVHRTLVAAEGCAMILPFMILRFLEHRTNLQNHQGQNHEEQGPLHFPHRLGVLSPLNGRLGNLPHDFFSSIRWGVRCDK